MMISTKSDTFISVILYTYNNQNICIDYLNNLYKYLFKRYLFFEVIIVDDNSTDKTVDEIEKNAAVTGNECTLIRLSYHQGLEQAMKAAIDFAIGDIVLQIDNISLEYDIEKFDELTRAVSEGNDIAFLAPQKQSLLSTVFYYFMTGFNKFKATFRTVVACIITRRGLNQVSKIDDKLFYRQFFYNIIGFQKRTILYDNKKIVNSSYSFREKFRLAMNLLFSFTDIGLKLNIIFALMCLIALLVFSVCIISAYINQTNMILPLIGALSSFYLLIIFLFFAVTIKYFEILLKEAKNLPKYTIEEIKKIN